MTGINQRASRSRQITLAASLAAVYFVLRSIPTFEMVGISSRFTAGDFALTLIALIGGFWSGTFAVLIGTILAYGVRPPIFLGLDFLPAVTNVSIATLLLAGRRRIAQGIYAVVFSAFVLSPYSLAFGYDFIPYTWMHIVALVILLSPLAGKIPTWVKNGGRLSQTASILILGFVGTMGQHLTGGLLYEFTVGFIGGISPPKFWDFWRIIFWLYPIERLFITALSAIIAIAVYRSIRRLSL